mgnify:CR=1 FL=1
MHVAVVGHVESILFAVVPHMPVAGEIIHAEETFEEPAGGGAVSAVQLAKLAGEATLYTALGDDEYGHRAEDRLRGLGLRVMVVWRRELQRRGFVHLDSNAERTITVIGSRLGPRGDDPLPWHELAETDAVYFTAGDAAAARAARAARVGEERRRRVGAGEARQTWQWNLLEYTSRIGQRPGKYHCTSHGSFARQ